MCKVFSSLLVVLAFCWAGSAIAIPVTVNGLEWYQPNEITGHTWAEFSAACPAGDCGLLGATDLTGWTWATSDDVSALFNYFIGSPEVSAPSYEYAISGSTWAPTFLSLFTPTHVDPGFGGFEAQIVGFTVNEWSENTLYGTFADVNDAKTVRPIGTVYMDSARANIGVDKGALFGGAWLYRDVAVVPLPATVSLFCLGLAVLGYTRRVHKQHS